MRCRREDFGAIYPTTINTLRALLPLCGAWKEKSVRSRGQVEEWSDHSRMQAVWKRWPQGNKEERCERAMSSRQIVQWIAAAGGGVGAGCAT